MKYKISLYFFGKKEPIHETLDDIDDALSRLESLAFSTGCVGGGMKRGSITGGWLAKTIKKESCPRAGVENGAQSFALEITKLN
jgi:hypothetical protein